MLNWAIIGCGVIAPNHIGAVLASDGAQVYAVCDVDEQKAKECAEKCNAEKIYTDYKEMLKDPKIDVVSICTPSGMHAEMAIEAANRKKHVLVEKPMDVTKEKIDAMIRAARDNGIKMACVYQIRTGPGAVAARKFIEEHDLGRLLYGEAHAQYFRSAEYYKSAGWRATWEYDGGGCLMNQGIHMLDLFRWIMGEVKTVTARCKTLVHDIPVEDSALAIVEFESGAMGIIEGSTATQPAQEGMVRLFFEKGNLTFNDQKLMGEFADKELKVPDVEAGATAVKEDAKALWAKSHNVIVQDLVDAIKEDREPMVPPEEGRKSVELILAIYESSKENKTIYMD